MSDLLEEAIALHKAGRLDEALPLYERAVAAAPTRLAAREMLGNCRFDLEHWAAAADCYRAAIELDAQRASPHYNLGNALLALGQLTAAEAAYQRALALQPSWAAAHLNLGMVYTEQEQWDDAVRCFRQAAAADPQELRPAAAYSLARALYAQSRWDEALAAFREALQTRPGFAAALSGLASVLVKLGRGDEALAEQHRALERWPDVAELHFIHGLTLLELARGAEAAESFCSAMELDPSYSNVAEYVGHALYRGSRIADLQTLLDVWLRRRPDDPRAKHLRAAWTGQNIAPRASEAYVRGLFDEFARGFDETLTQLQYRAPNLVADEVAKRAAGAAGGEILDAGCGTGLCGPLLRPWARRLVGVDLSPRMLERARRCGAYDELVEAELTDFLRRNPGRFNVVASADTLVYFGDLQPPLSAAAAALRPGGLLVFTVEQAMDAGHAEVCLNPHGRYSHTAAYVQRCLAEAGLQLQSLATEVLRREGEQPVPGLLVAAARPAASRPPVPDAIAELFAQAGQAEAAGRLSDAVQHLEQLLNLRPEHWEARHNLAVLLWQQRQPAAAIAQMQEAARLQPQAVEVANNLGFFLEQSGRTDAALEHYRRAAELAPDQAAPWFNLGRALGRAGRMEAAVAALQAAVRLDQNLSEGWAMLGAALLDQGHADRAAAALRQAVTLRPADSDAWRRLGDALRALGRPGEAVASYQQAVGRRPNDSEAWCGLGLAQADCAETPEAITAFRQCLALVPQHARATHELGKALFELGCIEQAMPLLRRAAELCPEQVRTQAWENLAVLVPGNPADDHRSILETRRTWRQRLPIPAAPRRGPTWSCGPVRIGYVSSFFERANWMKPVSALVNHHDRERFQVHVFSDAPADQVRDGYRPQAGDRYFDISGQTNEAAAALIAEQHLDILIDLNGYSAPRRLPLFLLRPAPVQVAWFNLYAPSGLECFDYLIGDEHVIPAAEEPYYTERILRVPHSYLTFEVGYRVPDVAPPPVLATGCVTMGCLASQYKITDQVIETWSVILRRSPDARMLIRNATLNRLGRRAHLAARFVAGGIPAERLLLEGPGEHYQFLETYGRIDFALDVFPYSGGTTTMEALWQGVPVVTFNGDRWASRTSLSLLRAAGLDEFIAADRQGYIERCVQLANDPDTPARLQALRAGLRERVRNSPVCDGTTMARSMETLYLGMLTPAGSGP